MDSYTKKILWNGGTRKNWITVVNRNSSFYYILKKNTFLPGLVLDFRTGLFDAPRRIGSFEAS
jgi:hypothetical protein